MASRGFEVRPESRYNMCNSYIGEGMLLCTKVLFILLGVREKTKTGAELFSCYFGCMAHIL